MVMEDELIKRHDYNNDSNTSQLNSSQDKTGQDEVYIGSLHIITMTITMSITMSMKIIIQ